MSIMSEWKGESQERGSWWGPSIWPRTSITLKCPRSHCLFQSREDRQFWKGEGVSGRGGGGEVDKIMLIAK